MADPMEKTDKFLETDTGKATQDAAFILVGGMLGGPIGAVIGSIASAAIREDNKPKTTQPPQNDRGSR
jgi:hypothetical protein